MKVMSSRSTCSQWQAKGKESCSAKVRPSSTTSAATGIRTCPGPYGFLSAPPCSGSSPSQTAVNMASRPVTAARRAVTQSSTLRSSDNRSAGDAPAAQAGPGRHEGALQCSRLLHSPHCEPPGTRSTPPANTGSCAARTSIRRLTALRPAGGPPCPSSGRAYRL